jgi:hypothetical protein
MPNLRKLILNIYKTTITDKNQIKMFVFYQRDAPLSQITPPLSGDNEITEPSLKANYRKRISL